MPCALPIRSEEHTSELQSPCNLVCRVLFRSDRKSTRLNSSHLVISYAVFCLKKREHLKIEHVLNALVQLHAAYAALSLPGAYLSGHAYDDGRVQQSAPAWLTASFVFFLMKRRPPNAPPLPSRGSSD